MSNPNPVTHHLRKQPAKWLHIPTKVIRVPEIFVEAIESYAKKLDAGQELMNFPPSPDHPPQSNTWFGLKPSISQLGWAVIEGDESLTEPHLLDYGTIETNAKDPLAQRLAEIEKDLSDLLEQFRPARVALETPFLNTEYPSGRKLLQVLGAINATIYRYCHVLPVTIYTASWKSHLDSARADREEIAGTVESLFNLPRLPLNASVDAIAIAYAGWCGVGSV